MSGCDLSCQLGHVLSLRSTRQTEAGRCWASTRWSLSCPCDRTRLLADRRQWSQINDLINTQSAVRAAMLNTMQALTGHQRVCFQSWLHRICQVHFSAEGADESRAGSSRTSGPSPAVNVLAVCSSPLKVSVGGGRAAGRLMERRMLCAREASRGHGAERSLDGPKQRDHLINI